MTATVDVEDLLLKLNNVEKVALLAGLIILDLQFDMLLIALGLDWWHTGMLLS